MKIIFNLFFDLVYKFPFHFIILLIFIFSQSFLNLASVITLAPVIDLMSLKTTEEYSFITIYFKNFANYFGYNLELIYVFIFFSIAIITVAFLNILIEFILLKIKYSVLNYLLTDTLKQFFKSKLSFFVMGNMGTLLNSFGNEVSKIGNTFGGLATVGANILQSLIFLLLPLTLSFQLTLSFLVLALFITSPLWIIKGLTYKLGKKNTETANVNTGVLHTALTSAKLIISYACQVQTIDLYKKTIQDHIKVSIPFQLITRALPIIFSPLAIIAALVVIYYNFINGFPLGEMVVIFFSLTRLIPTVGVVLHGLNAVQGFIPAYEQLLRLKNESKKYQENNEGKKFKKLFNKIEFYNVNFSFKNRNFKLQNLNIVFKKGKTTAIVGESGSGKTTVVDLLMGLYFYDSGKIKIDELDFEDLNLNSFRSKIGYVPQESQMFDLSIRDNIKWAKPLATDEEIYKVCEVANIKSYIDDLPLKLDTILGERGVLMSGGQRQRLALARSLIRNPEILILDEATSSLDMKSEGLINQSLKHLSSKGMTIIIVAHRSIILENADVIYKFDNGKIINSVK